MNKATSIYVNPLTERYASPEMLHLFSPDYKFGTWRKLWIALAECEKDLGLPISQEQIDEMKAHIADIDYDRVRALEKQTRHDVMAHVLGLGELCPKARPIIHLGATSAYVGDNTDLIQTREACLIVIRRVAATIAVLRDFALSNKDVATLGFTHFQPAQLVTVGKRACLWMQDLAMDLEDLIHFVERIPFLGVKGTTGTQASFLSLFEGNHDRVKELDLAVTKKMGFGRLLPVAGQTYPRKIDAQALAALSGLAQSLHKLANDIRLLQHLKEIEEPFESTQIGSSAMAYKRNPMRSERMTSLARFIISLSQSTAMTAAEQWFERTLDDSANKRLAVPEAFLAADACLQLAQNICTGLVVYPNVINKHIQEELPFMATENIIMAGVKKGGDRQALHEQIRQHSHAAGLRVKMDAKNNDLLDRIIADKQIGLSRTEVEALMRIEEFVGRAPQQVTEYVRDCIDPLLEKAGQFGAALDATVTV